MAHDVGDRDHHRVFPEPAATVSIVKRYAAPTECRSCKRLVPSGCRSCTVQQVSTLVMRKGHRVDVDEEQMMSPVNVFTDASI